ncbi:MAG: efflux RND transporter permease subunit [Clostridiales bacterium]|nr:efflux RND transporter permease subunit [Eubacterium sp.]MDD7349996.1 efflux RND transporter permease subunit [Clostridiales bacterium]
MVKFGKFITKHKLIILLLGVLLIIPSMIGMIKTRINYDVLSYLPDSLETVSGQNVMVDEFGMGAFSMVVVENMENKDVVALKEKLEKVEHVEKIIWYDSVADISLPTDMLPNELKEALFNGNATMMIALFDNTTSSDDTMQAVTEMRKEVKDQAFISGMSGIVTDIKNLVQAELPIYIVIAAVLALLVLLLTMESIVTPVLFLICIGLAILYNMGTNIFFGEISYITQALTAVLQLGVTMDYSIFLLESYQANKERFDNDKERAMAHAIGNTFKSVVGSSITTVAGFAALCFMTFALGRDLGIVMAKGVIIGVVVCITLLPALILFFDKWIDKTTHRAIFPDFHKASTFITKHRILPLILFVILFVPALYGNNHVKVYYNLDQALPQTLDSAIANKKLEEKFNMNNMHVLLLKNGLTNKEKNDMKTEIEKVDGVKWMLGMNSIVGASVPDDMIPSKYKDMLKSDNWELQFICSDYKTATDEVNAQIASIHDIVKKYSKDSMVIGEAPLTKDLEDVTDIDLARVNYMSIGAIFLIILLTFKSISLPVILVSVIEFAIFLNMSIPYYSGTELPFVASIVIGTIQLGATVDYAILMTTRYHKERVINQKGKKESIEIAHKASMKSIIISGLSFFAVTFGVSAYSSIDMINAICTLLSRGAVISTISVILVLPAMLYLFDKVICKTTWDMRKINY